MKNNSKLTSFLLILLAASLGGSIGVFTKIGVEEIPPFSFVFIRFIFALLVLIPFFIRSKPKFKKDLYKVFLLSLLATANVILFSFGIKLTTANIGQTLYTTVPIISAIISYFLLKEKFNLYKIAGIILGFLGVAIVILLPIISQNIDVSLGMKGNLLILLATISYSFYSVLTKKFQKSYSPVQLVSYFALTTTIFTSIFLLSDLSLYPKWWQEVTFMGLFSATFVGLIGTTIYFLIVQLIIKKTTPVVASTILYLQPLSAFIWSHMFLKETLTFILIVGFFLSAIGVFLTNYFSKK